MKTDYYQRAINNLKKVKEEKRLRWDEKDFGPHWRAMQNMCNGTTSNGMSLKAFCDTCDYIGVLPYKMLNKDL